MILQQNIEKTVGISAEKIIGQGRGKEFFSIFFAGIGKLCDFQNPLYNAVTL